MYISDQKMINIYSNVFGQLYFTSDEILNRCEHFSFRAKVMGSTKENSPNPVLHLDCPVSMSGSPLQLCVQGVTPLTQANSVKEARPASSVELLS